jgi:hypothetical protein
MAPKEVFFYAAVMDWNDVFRAAYQVPLCFSAAFLIVSVAQVLYEDLFHWMAGVES